MHAENPRNTADSRAVGRRLILAELTVQGIESGALSCEMNANRINDCGGDSDGFPDDSRRWNFSDG